MLHIITQSHFQHAALKECLTIIAVGDSLLLLADGVYATLTHEITQYQITCYVIREDVQSRGLEERQGFTYIDYAEMVDLTDQHHPIMTWS
jgi:sulfur relay protein TusB/DsrH